MFTEIDLSNKEEITKEATQAEDSNDIKKKSFFYTHFLLPFKKNPLTSTSIVLVLLSTVLLFILLIGSRTRAIYLSKFDFEEPIRFITHKNDITFTLYGHCVDDQCTTPNMVHNFDQLPSSSDIASSGGQKAKRFDVGGTIQNAGNTASNTAQNVGNTASNTAQNAGNTASNAAQNVGNTASNVGNTASNAAQNAGNAVSSGVQDVGNTTIGNTTVGSAISNGVNSAENIAKDAPGLLAALLKGFENFTPKRPTVKFSGFISIPYLLALIFNFFTLVLLYFHLPTLATLFLLASALLNALALFFDLLVFVWVFQLVALIPGIGKQYTGPGIVLAGWSALFLGIAALLLGGRLYYKLCCGGWCRDAFKGVKKGVSRGIKKMRKQKEAEEDKQKKLLERV